jgi:phosphoribosylamine--glycine ligase
MAQLKLLVIGGGGREHALAWKLAQSPRAATVYVAPGNAGTAREPRCENVPIGADDIDALVRFAGERGVDLTVVGPEAPLVAGIVDRFRAAGLRIFGPTAAAARLEGSKAYAKRFLERHGIPTARHWETADYAETERLAGRLRFPCVLKADGLAAGKGVVIAPSREQFLQAAREIQQQGLLGDAGRRLVIEDLLQGEEASFIVMADGNAVLPFPSAQDHKRVYDGDQGPNTGGMGAYSPAPVVTPAVAERVLREVIEPTVHGLAAEGQPYTGFLYAGLMIAPDGTPNVLEFNCRFGDPEAQPLLMRLETDLVQLLEAALERRLDSVGARFDARAALGVVLAAGGYPGAYGKGDTVQGLPERDEADVKVFHAGTALRDHEVVTSGGRVLCVTALGATVAAARARAYEVAERIHWNNIHYRRDIGYRAIARETQ